MHYTADVSIHPTGKLMGVIIVQPVDPRYGARDLVPVDDPIALEIDIKPPNRVRLFASDRRPERTAHAQADTGLQSLLTNAEQDAQARAVTPVHPAEVDLDTPSPTGYSRFQLPPQPARGQEIHCTRHRHHHPVTRPDDGHAQPHTVLAHPVTAHTASLPRLSAAVTERIPARTKPAEARTTQPVDRPSVPT